MSRSRGRVSSAGCDRHSGRTPSVLSLGFFAIVFGVILSWQTAALGQDSCSGRETVKTKCKTDGDLVKRITVNLKKGQSNATYFARLDTGEELKKDTNRKGKAKFKFKFPRKNRPACVPGNSASVGVNEQGEFQ